MNYRRRLKKISVLLISSFMLCGVSWAGIPDVNHLLVTDVTTRSFSVIWTASEESTADLAVFEDESGQAPVNRAEIVAHPVASGNGAIKEAAESNGVMKVRVTGLEPDTTYYFRTITTSKSTDETVQFPDSAPFLPVTTEHLTVRAADDGDDLVPFSNDIIIQPCFLDDGETPATGTLLVATVEGADYPLTAFVGDGLAPPNALIDLNNMFSLTSHENLDLFAGKNLTLLNFRGTKGNAIITYNTPIDNSLTEIKPPADSLKPGWNMISIQLAPNDTSTAAVLDPIIEHISSIWTYDSALDKWNRYDKLSPFPWLNDLTDIQSNHGYWLYVDTETSLQVKGSFPSEYQQLHTGWTLAGSPFIETTPLQDAITTIQEHLTSIWTYDLTSDKWLRYDKDNPFPWLNDLQYIEPGKAYWVNVTEDCQW